MIIVDRICLNENIEINNITIEGAINLLCVKGENGKIVLYYTKDTLLKKHLRCTFYITETKASASWIIQVRPTYFGSCKLENTTYHVFVTKK